MFVSDNPRYPRNSAKKGKDDPIDPNDALIMWPDVAKWLHEAVNVKSVRAKSSAKGETLSDFDQLWTGYCRVLCDEVLLKLSKWYSGACLDCCCSLVLMLRFWAHPLCSMSSWFMF